MGIFSLFGKKDGEQATSADRNASHAKRNASAQRPGGSRADARPSAVKRDTQAALATALKIDAIESEMSSEFVNLPTTQQPGGHRGRTPAPHKTVVAPQANPPVEIAISTPSSPLQPLSAEGTTTGLLLEGAGTVDDLAAPSSEAAAVIEEAAILYANGQTGLVEQMLKSAIEEDLLGGVTQKAWRMLFDLYQILGKQQEFDHLSITYANKFETSPPTWTDIARPETQQAKPVGATPIVPFGAKLDGSSAKLIERIRKLAETQQALRLEFTRVTEVDPAGCQLLLNILKTLQKSGHDLVLAGAAELAGRIRTIIEVGRRDDTEDAWLLLLEILRLLNREQEFEETSIDYCVTFEVSPPAFVAPQSSVTTTTETQASVDEAEGFMMPALIEGRIDNLILAIAAYSDEHEPALIDCSQLARVDFNAAGRLLTGLAPFCGSGKAVEFHHVNHLVAELFNVIGLKDIVRILPRKS